MQNDGSLISLYVMNCFTHSRLRQKTTTLLLSLWALLCIEAVASQTAPSQAAADTKHFDIQEYKVLGATKLSTVEVETAIYPYLGPYRTAEDVEQARAALEKAYRDKGFQAASVQIPQQSVTTGVITLQVSEGEIGRVRVQGARYYSPSEIKAMAPSMREGTVLDFKAIKNDIVALNQSADRRVMPALKAGSQPGTVDVDLNVKDTFPLHGSLEFNNRYSSGTKQFRLNGSVSYNNLWQLGHTIGMSFQVAPEDVGEVKVFSGYYMAPVPDVEWLTLMLQGTKQDSNVSTLGGAAVAGKGEVAGPRMIITLPGENADDRGFFQSVTLGIDYKSYEQVLTIAGTDSTSPITYYPLSAAYSGTWVGKGYTTEFNSTVTAHLRGMGSSANNFDNKRYNADGGFIYLRNDLAHTRDLPGEGQIYGKVQSQISNEPLLDSEQFSAGGIGTVRGYLESEAVGDDAYMGSLELRSPSLSAWLDKAVQEWRFYLFGEAARLTIHDALPEQTDAFNLTSFGVGSRWKVKEHFNGSLDLGVPVLEGVNTSAYKPRLTFRLWADF